MRKIAILLLATLWLSGTAWAQENVAKLGLTPFLFGNTNLNYERAIGERFSINAKLGFGIPSNNVPLTGSSGGQISDGRYRAFEATPELRIYSKKKGALRGFYWGPWLRYRQWSISGTDDFTTYQTSVDASLSTFNGGILLGAQWLINDVISIDWSFFGLGLGVYNLRGELISDDPSVDWEQVRRDVEAEIGESLDNIPGLDFDASNEGGRVAVSLPFPSVAFRSSLAVGIAF